MIGEETLYLSITELGPRIRERLLSPVELTEAYLLRIARYDKSLNAFARLTPDVALQQARKAEAEVNAGKYRGPLHGIPYGAKDLLATANIPTEWGAAPCKGQVFNRDATVVRKLRDAGAVLLGKLAMVEFAGCLGYRNANASISGPGRNPWDRSRWTGGSSSGSGAAVSAGLVGFALGTETWGSILCPSAFCGLTGLRPTYGRVSRAGGMVCSDTFDKVGPLARSAADCRAILATIAGPDDADPSAADEPLDFAIAQPLSGNLRAGVFALDFTKFGEPEVKRGFEDAVMVLRSLGVHTEPATLPTFPASDVAGAIITAEALSAFEDFYKDGRVKQLKDPYAPYQIEVATGMTGADLAKAWRMRTVLQQKMRDFFDRYDVILSPNFMSVAPSVDKDLNETLAYPDPMGGIGNACGLPALAMPTGLGRDRLPTSFQIMGPPWSEGLLLDLGEAFQARTKHHLARPPVMAAVR
jgi:aspartyl-tRNA(Asn)/glutamyl-tRNA(Gln) amidotransferase subunit A